MAKRTPVKKKMSAEERAERKRERDRAYRARKKAGQTASKKKAAAKKVSKRTTAKTSKPVVKKSGPDPNSDYQKVFQEVAANGRADFKVPKGVEAGTQVARLSTAWRRAVASGRLDLGGGRIRIMQKDASELILIKV